jgi:hypothetical protein
MPNDEMPERTTRTLNDDYTTEYDHENGWLTLVLTTGLRLNLSPGTAQKLRDFLNEVLPPDKDDGRCNQTEP